MYYQKNINEVLEALQTHFHGLSGEEANERQKKYGPNSIQEEKTEQVWLIFLKQFKDPLIYILLVAALFTLSIKHYIDTAVIITVISVNALLGLFQEYKAEKAMQAIKKLVEQKASVIRENQEQRISSEDLVPGDIVIIAAGNKVPADIRLIEVKEIEIDESMFTGESAAVTKQVQEMTGINISLPDQLNMGFMGTVILKGRGKGVVVNTGDRTELGKISKSVKSTIKELTPLQKKLADFSKKVGILSVTVSAIVFILGLFEGIPVDNMILFSISMAVAIIPEGLPVVITVTMSVGLKRMAEKNAIIRKLIAVETLGSCNYICSDKTGTLTENMMTVTKAYANGKEFSLSGTGYNPQGKIFFNDSPIKQDKDLEELLLTGLLCNSSEVYEEDNTWKIDGDPTEGALIVSAIKYGIVQDDPDSRYQLVDEIAFSSQRQYMATLYKQENKYILFVKGAPEKILAFSNEQNNHIITQQYHSMAEEGLRVLGFGIKELNRLDTGQFDLEQEATRNLSFVGLQGIIDPPRPRAIEAIKNAHIAGIKVVMITGDHKITATAIAERTGILEKGGIVLTGQELDLKGVTFLAENVNKVMVYARVSPQHKLSIVDALQRKNNIVAVTGDGINDAPALKKANIGVAMGKAGTDVAKEAADMVLKDDNFASIFEAVKVGRVIYDNIRKVIFFLLATAAGIPLAIILCLILDLPLPFIATQVLWVNLVTNGLQDIALAYEPGEEDIANRPPRNPRENIINREMLSGIVLVGIVSAFAMVLIYRYELNNGTGLRYARSAALNTAVFLQFFHVWNSRSFKKSIFKVPPLSNPFLFISLTIAIIAQIIVINVPFFHYIFGTAPLTLLSWVQTISAALSIIVVMEIAKWISRKKSG